MALRLGALPVAGIVQPTGRQDTGPAWLLPGAQADQA